MNSFVGWDGGRIPQRPDELAALIKLICDIDARSYLEIGLQRGMTFHRICTQATQLETMVGIDLPGGEWGVIDGREAIEATVKDLHARGRDARVIVGNSQDPYIITEAAERGPYDVVFIDGDHRPAGVRADWQNYRCVAKVVAFHDIDTPAFPGITPQKAAKYGVHALWQELKAGHRHVEFIGAERGMGIGVLWTGN